MIGAGDIASCEGSDGDDETAAIVAANPDSTVFALGDNAYSNGSPAQYANCYDPTWGPFKSRTRPVIGDHDMETAPAGQAYRDYFQAQLAQFGSTATDLTKLYYSYDIGSWHVVVANSICYFGTYTCNPTQMEQWIADDIAAHPTSCTMMMWHSTRWSSGNIHANQTFVQPLWRLAYDKGVDLVLSGDEHVYERFAPMDATGAPDPQFGVRQINVGTGGYFRYDLGTRLPTSEVFNSNAWGVLKLTLHSGSYDWQFIPEAGKTFTDTGTTACHGAPSVPDGGPQIRSSSSASVNQGATSLPIPQPAGTQAGDLLLAVAGHQGGTTRTMSAPAGWTNIPGADVSEGGNARIRAWYKVAGPSEPATYSFPVAGGTNWSSAGGIMAITGANTSSPVAAAAGAVRASSQNLMAPSITTTDPNTLVVYGGAVNQPALFTPPPLFAERWDLSSATTYNVATETAVRVATTAGATGTATAFLNVSAPGVAVQIAIRGSG
jgi:hypothetical protein